MEANRSMLANKSEIGRALSLYNKVLFWEYSEREIQLLGPELVIPRVTRYGTLNDIIRLFAIFPPDTIYDVVNKDRELDSTEKTFLNDFYFNVGSPLKGCTGVTDKGIKLNVFDYSDSFVKQANIVDGIRLASLLDIGLMKLDDQNRRNTWKDIIDLNIITNFHPLSELLSVYNQRYPAWPKKQCFMALVKNLETPPSLDNFPYDLMFNNSKPDDIISDLKKKCVEVYKSIFQQESEIIKSWIKPYDVKDISKDLSDQKGKIKTLNKNSGISM